MPSGSQPSSSLFPQPLQERKHVAGRHWVGAYRNVVVCYWVQTCTTEELRGLRAIYQALAAEGKTTVSVVHYVEQGVGLPVPNLREELATKAGQHLPSLGCVSVVLAGAGFWASALSSFIVGVRMLLPKSTLPVRVTRDLDELRPWLLVEHERTTGQRLDPLPLHAWIEQARAAMLSSPSP